MPADPPGRAPADPAQPRTEDVSATEQVNLRESGVDVALPEHLRTLRDHFVEAFGDLEVLGFRGELTMLVAPERIVDVLRFAKEDPVVDCQYLMDLSCVHWPGGEFRQQAHETTGWPTMVTERQGYLEVDYILYSITHNHRFRLRVTVGDEEPAVPSASEVYASANFMEREAYDFFGVVFVGHPNLRRIHMPDNWEGYPQRKDYPLGGVAVEYKGEAFIPPPDQRKY